MKLLFVQDKLIKLLDENDIPCVILRGCAAAQYYPKPHLRAMGDVDFLVSQEKFMFAAKLLEENGYKDIHGTKQDDNIPKGIRHIGYEKNGIEYELHHHFSSAGFEIDDILELAIKKGEYRDLDGYIIPMLPDFENGLVLLGHIHQHLSLDYLGFRQIIDWIMFVDITLNNKADVLFSDLLKKLNKKKFADNITLMCVNYMGLNYDKNILDEIDEGNASQLLNMLFENGNFGRKATASSNTNGSISSGIYKKQGYFSYFQDLGLKRWKLCHTHIFKAVRLGLWDIQIHI